MVGSGRKVSPVDAVAVVSQTEAPGQTLWKGFAILNAIVDGELYFQPRYFLWNLAFGQQFRWREGQ